MWGSLQQVCGAGMALAQGGERCGWETSEPALGLERGIAEAGSGGCSQLLLLPSAGTGWARQRSVSCSPLSAARWEAAGRGAAAAWPPSERQRVGCRGRCWLIVSGEKWEAIELIQIPGLKILSLAEWVSDQCIFFSDAFALRSQFRGSRENGQDIRSLAGCATHSVPRCSPCKRLYQSEVPGRLWFQRRLWLGCRLGRGFESFFFSGGSSLSGIQKLFLLMGHWILFIRPFWLIWKTQSLRDKQSISFALIAKSVSIHIHVKSVFTVNDWTKKVQLQEYINSTEGNRLFHSVHPQKS